MVVVNYNYYNLKKITKIIAENILITNNMTLKEVLDILIDKYGEVLKSELFDLKTGNFKLIILVNGRAATDLNIKIKINDKINIISSLRGG
jgi:molybdopterin converting factor small subunit